LARESEQAIEHLFRKEYGKLVSVVTHFFGPSYIQLAEDVVQETLISALSNWSTQGIPENPQAWLFQVAKRKVLNEIERGKMMQRHEGQLLSATYDDIDLEVVFLDDEIQDSQLRMIFTCCHALLDTKSQIALTLKTLCGFGVKEVARALLSSESSINKSLYRAREKIRNSQTPFDIPQGEELNKKLEAVSLTMYLLFNEGYNSSVGDSVIKKELCWEAMRLTKLLVDHFQDNKNLLALLALMSLHAARFEARIDNRGAIVLFEDQDRSLWNKELINVGMHHFNRSLNAGQLSAYHIEARIAAEHCLSTSFESTHWQLIYDQYLLLQQLKPNPVIELNLAIIQSQIGSIESSLSQLEKLSQRQSLRDYHLLSVTQGVFNMKLRNYEQALSYFRQSLKQKPSKKEVMFIMNKMDECEKLLPKH